MEILKVCLLISCLTLSIRHSVSQFGPFPGGFDGGYINYNSRNSLPPPQQQFERQSSGNCDQFWSYDSDYNGQFGVIRITRPDYRTSTIRVVLSIAAQLAPVRTNVLRLKQKARVILFTAEILVTSWHHRKISWTPKFCVTQRFEIVSLDDLFSVDILSLIQKNSGSLDLSKNLEATISDISQGLPLFYRVNFPIPHPVPHIMEIYYNDQLLCTAPKGSLVFERFESAMKDSFDFSDRKLCDDNHTWLLFLHWVETSTTGSSSRTTMADTTDATRTATSHSRDCARSYDQKAPSDYSEKHDIIPTCWATFNLRCCFWMRCPRVQATNYNRIDIPRKGSWPRAVPLVAKDFIHFYNQPI